MKDWWTNSVVYQNYPREALRDPNGDGFGDLQGYY